MRTTEHLRRAEQHSAGRLVEPPVSLPLHAEAMTITTCLLQSVTSAERVDAPDGEQIAHRVPHGTKGMVGKHMR